MTTARNVFKNASSLLVGSAVSQMLRALYASLLSRYAGAEGFGQVSTATAVVVLLMPVVNFGLGTLIVRDVAADRTYAAKYVTNVAFIRLLLALVFVVVLAAIVSQSPYSYETRVIIAIYALSHVFDVFSGVGYSIFHAFQKMQYSAVLDLAHSFLYVAVSVLGIHLGWTLVTIVSVAAFASFMRLVATVIAMQRRFVRPVLKVNLSLCRSLLVSSLPFFLLLSVSTAFEKLSLIILSWMDITEAVGIYSAATMPIAVLLMLPAMFYHSIFPVFCRYYRTSAAALGRSFRVSYKVMLLIGFPMGAGMMLVSRYVIPLVYGPGFENAVPVANILAIQLFVMVGFVNGAFLSATGRQTLFAVLQVASVALNAILCFCLIPHYRYLGAAMALAITESVNLGL